MKDQNKSKKYNVYFCLNGRKRKYVEKLTVSQQTWKYRLEIWPLDVIDEDDHNIWFDYGDE